jgi:formate hydrogenlyase subunit 4
MAGGGNIYEKRAIFRLSYTTGTLCAMPLTVFVKLLTKKNTFIDLAILMIAMVFILAGCDTGTNPELGPQKFVDPQCRFTSRRV